MKCAVGFHQPAERKPTRHQLRQHQQGRPLRAVLRHQRRGRHGNGCRRQPVCGPCLAGRGLCALTAWRTAGAHRVVPGAHHHQCRTDTRRAITRHHRICHGHGIAGPLDPAPTPLSTPARASGVLQQRPRAIAEIPTFLSRLVDHAALSCAAPQGKCRCLPSRPRQACRSGQFCISIKDMYWIEIHISRRCPTKLLFHCRTTPTKPVKSQSELSYMACRTG